MTRIILWGATCWLSALAAAGQAAEPELTAAQVVDKNVAARGGLEAWRKVQTMAWMGHVEIGNAAGSRMAFVLEMKRPDKTRFEIRAQSQKFVRMYDGTHGWKLRPTRSGTPDLEPYSADEAAFARDAQSLDGPLVDYQAKGVHVELEGMDEVDGRKAYRLRVGLPSGATHHVWIDAHTYLDVKSDREAHNAFGMKGTVWMRYRDYRTVNGLQIPFLIESGATAGKTTDKMVIETAFVNPPLKDWMFGRPSVPGRRRTVAVAAEASVVAPGPAWQGKPTMRERPSSSQAFQSSAGHAQ